ncbi:response regulator [bacterium]|nr:response regulator [bacterium]
MLAADTQDNLGEMGFEVVGLASTGLKAIEMAAALKPEVVLMDIQLRGEMDGIQAAEQIRAQTGCAIVFQTAYAEDPILDRAVNTEPHGYLVKPVSYRELKATIHMAVYKVRMEAERARLQKELVHANEEIDTLRGLIPVCAWCKKVRDDEGFWQTIEDYLKVQSGNLISHGMCPDCAAEFDRAANSRRDPS